MKLLIDTNVILDYLLGDADLSNIKEVIMAIERKEVVGYITASAVTDIQYILSNRLIKADRAHEEPDYQHKTRREITEEATNDLEEFLSLFRILSLNESDIRTAFSLKWKDFEDSVQYVAAKNNGIDTIITRNTKDFKDADITVMTPREFVVSGN